MAHPGGRPPKFATPEILWDTFLEWKQEFEEGGSLVDDIPDIEGFCDYVGAWRDLLLDYEKKPEFSRACKALKNWIYSRKKQLAMKNKMNAAVFIFDAKNNAGYTDKQELDHTTNGKDLPTPILGGLSKKNTTDDRI